MHRLAAAGARVPMRHNFHEGVLPMELVADADGEPAPRLNDVALSPELARQYHTFLIRQVILMLCAGVVHGDLSEYNFLVDGIGPVIIDLPPATKTRRGGHARKRSRSRATDRGPSRFGT